MAHSNRIRRPSCHGQKSAPRCTIFCNNYSAHHTHSLRGDILYRATSTSTDQETPSPSEKTLNFAEKIPKRAQDRLHDSSGCWGVLSLHCAAYCFAVFLYRRRVARRRLKGKTRVPLGQHGGVLQQLLKPVPLLLEELSVSFSS